MTEQKEERLNNMRIENSKDKYFEYLDFLLGLIRPNSGDTVIDYDCGIATAVKYYRNTVDRVNFLGYDKDGYLNDVPYSKHYKIDKLQPCNIMYFFDSFQKINDDERTELLKWFKGNVRRRVIIVMDNANHNKLITEKRRNNYTLRNLMELFKSNGSKIVTAGQFGDIDTLGNCEKIFVVVKP